MPKYQIFSTQCQHMWQANQILRWEPELRKCGRQIVGKKLEEIKMSDNQQIQGITS